MRKVMDMNQASECIDSRQHTGQPWNDMHPEALESMSSLRGDERGMGSMLSKASMVFILTDENVAPFWLPEVAHWLHCDSAINIGNKGYVRDNLTALLSMLDRVLDDVGSRPDFTYTGEGRLLFIHRKALLSLYHGLSGKAFHLRQQYVRLKIETLYFAGDDRNDHSCRRFIIVI